MSRNVRLSILILVPVLLIALALPAAAKPKTFLGSDDAKSEGEPHKFLPDYDKLMEGKDADWVYFPAGSLKAYKKVSVKEFGSTSEDEDHKDEAETAQKYGKKYAEQWLKKAGWEVAEAGDVVIEGNVFNAWEPSGGARFWGGWMANPGCGLELIAKDSSGKIVAEIRHKSRGSTVKDAVENGLENMVKALAAGK